MGRTITVATEGKVTQIATEPGFLVELTFPLTGIVRQCTREQTAWNGFTWVTASLKLGGIEGSGQRGTLEYGDDDAAMRTLVLAEGINDRRVRVWKFYRGAVAPADPVLIFDGVGDGAQMRQGKVTIGVVRSGSRTLVTPRQRIGPATGFNHLPPEGTLIKWGRGETLRLERSRG